MLFAFICIDKSDHLQLRLDSRPAHVAFLEDLNARGVLKFAGPFLDGAGKPNGSLVVVEAPDRAAAEALAAAVGGGRVEVLAGAGRRGVLEQPAALAAIVATVAQGVPA